MDYPNGSKQDNGCFDILAVSDYWQTLSCTTGCVGDFRLADGGTVHFDNTNGYFQARTIKDPYGQTTSLAYDASGLLSRVTEPGGRYLLFAYNGPQGRLSRVEAHGLGNATVTDWVNYSYTSVSPGGNGASQYCLTGVSYSDGTSASYTYIQDNVPYNPAPCPCSLKLWPLLQTAQDVRYNGAMRHICYEYQTDGPHGAIIAERYSLNGSTNGPRVSWIDPPASSPLAAYPFFDTTYTEHRGDGPTRTFNYTDLHLHRFFDDSCPTRTFGPADQQFLLNYTDFQGKTTILGYDPNWYVNSVRDARNNTTSYLRGPPPNAYPGPRGTGEILRITHPDAKHIDYVYRDESPDISGHYVQEITNERGAITHYYRDSSNRVTRIDYKDSQGNILAYEQFTSYNSFGQVLTHRLKNGAWESFVYDSRGLLTDRYNPKSGGAPGFGDPYTHYDYYTSGAWTDRIQKITLPANTSGYAATETFEYDRTLSGGVTDLNGTPVAGRGLVTKITHTAPDNKYQTCKYDAYGNKVWEDNELRKATSYAYDNYNRLLSSTNPLSKTTQYDYASTPGNATQSQQHTTNSAWWIIMPSGIKTHNVYDETWRKTSTTPADGVLNSTSFAYDNVGNLTDVTDPRGKITHNVYDNRNRKTQTTEAYTTALAATTVWHYDPASNINQIDRPEDPPSMHETKGYDALNRMIWNNVPRQVPGASPTPAPINIRTDIFYNPSGTVEHVRDSRAKVTLFQYNASDEKTQMTYHDGSYQQWSWDNAHNLASRRTIGGETQNFTYDNRNRKTDMSWTPANGDWAHYGYDAASRLTSANNENSGITRTYDDANHLTLDQQNVTGLGSSKSVNYPPYDDDGRVTGVNVTNASYDYTYTYDAAGPSRRLSPQGDPRCLSTSTMPHPTRPIAMRTCLILRLLIRFTRAIA